MVVCYFYLSPELCHVIYRGQLVIGWLRKAASCMEYRWEPVHHEPRPHIPHNCQINLYKRLLST